MHISTRHRDRLKNTIEKRFLRLRIELLKDKRLNNESAWELDQRLENEAVWLANECLEILKVPAKKRSKKG